MSVEKHVRMAVRRMKADAAPDMVMEVVGMGLDGNVEAAPHSSSVCEACAGKYQAILWRGF